MKRKNILIKILILAIAFVMSMAAFGCSNGGNEGPSNTADVTFGGYFANNTVNINVGDSYTLNALNVKIKEWSSSDENVVSVDEKGVVVGKAQGVAFVYAVSEEGQTLCCVVSVLEEKAGVKEVTLNESEFYMSVGDGYTLTASIEYEGEDLNKVVEWSVSNQDVCSIESAGNEVYVSANAVGETFVVASVDGKVAQCKLVIGTQKTNESTFDQIPEEVSTSKMTKNYYELGRLNSATIQSGNKTELYNTAIYQNVVEPYSIVAFAKLAEGKKDFSWSTENYFAYGFYLKTIKVDNADAGMQGNDRIYYAYNGTDEVGQYGIEIEGVPSGYYIIYSFVEYMNNGEIVREISAQKISLGEYNSEYLNSAGNFEAFKINRSWPGGVKAGFNAEVIEKAEPYGGIMSKYQIPASAMQVHNKSYTMFPSVMVKAQTIMTKEMLQEVLSDGITVLRFKVCYKTGSDKAHVGELYTTNFSVLDSTFPKSVADIPSDKPLNSYTPVKNAEAKYEEFVMKASTSRDIKTNVWYTVEYSVKDLIEDYDVYFHPNAEYPLFSFSMSNEESNQAGIIKDGKVLITDMEFATISYEDIFAERDTYSFVLSANGKEDETNWKYLLTTTSNNRRCNSIDAEVPQNVREYEDASGVTKQVAYKFKYTYMSLAQWGQEEHVYNNEILPEQKDGNNKGMKPGRYLLIAFENSRIDKSLLEDLLLKGYEKLSFSIVVDDYGRADMLRIKTIDFDYLRANSNKKLMSTDRYGLKVNDEAFKTINVNANEARNWHTISYAIKDLIEFYDQIFGCPKLMLAQAYTDYTEGTSSQDQFPYYYITKVGFKKGFDFDKFEDQYPDIFD